MKRSDDQAAKFSFCERVTATPMSPWHIRHVGPEGQKFSGGAPDTTLCGASLGGGWDLQRVVDVPTVRLLQPHRDVCPECADAYLPLVAADLPVGVTQTKEAS